MTKEYSFAVPPRVNPQTQRLLPNVVDETAAAEPDAVWSEITVSPISYEAGFRPITWKALANAVNGLAALLEARLGRGQNFETLMYLGPSDPRTPMMVLASIKVGYKLLLSSPRNSVAAHDNLLTKLACRTIVTTTPQPPFVGPVLEAFPALRLVQIPSIDELLATSYPHYPYHKTYEEAKHDPMLCLHTSGSTGLPKPVVYPHEFVTVAINIAQLQPPDGYELLNTLIAGNRGIMLLPLFHIGGIHFSLFSTVMNRDNLIFPLATSPPTGATLGAILSQTDADWAFLAPTQLEDIPKDPKLFDLVASRLKLLITSGGSLSTSVGDLLSARVHLRTFLGSSEHSGFPHLIPKGATRSGKDWPYIELHPYANAEFREQSEGSFELVLNRKEEFQPWQTPFVVFPELHQFQTKDIFSAHPDKQDHWVHRGRDDDIVVFSNGEKTNPVSVEDVVASSSAVKSALVFGSGRFEAGILVELTPDEAAELSPASKAELLERLSPVIETANSAAPAHAQIAMTHVLFADPKKPFLRSGKGTVQRQLTLKAYDDEISALYDAIDSTGMESNGSVLRNGTTQETRDSAHETTILDALRLATDLTVADANQDLFALGLDSLQALRLARHLRTKLGYSSIAPSLIYANPSARALSAALASKEKVDKELPSTTQFNASESMFQKHWAYMQVLASCINQKMATTDKPRKTSHTLLLTGSSGFLGHYLLEALLESKIVSHIYCLNRRAIKCPTASRVTHLEADLAQPITFGLSTDVYDTLLASVTLIIHAAWPVDFIQPLSHFDRSLAGTTHLLLFAARAHQAPGVLYLSSVSAVSNLKGSNHLIESTIVTDTGAPTPGYGESKHVAERLVDSAARTFGVRSAIARIGQIAGPGRKPGSWNEKEWFPRLIRTSHAMGSLPNSLGARGDVLDWIPVDDVAKVLVDLGMVITTQPAKASPAAQVFNVINPRPGAWRNVLAEVQKASGDVYLVDRVEWLDQLRKVGANVEDSASSAKFAQSLERYPALPLESFYQSLFDDQAPLRMDTRSAEEASETLKNLARVDDAAVTPWIRAILSK